MGGKRGRLISAESKTESVFLIDEAVQNGARLFKACETLEISVTTYRRWSKDEVKDKRKGANKKVARKLQEDEKDKILEICCSDKYKDDNPYKIHASLLDEGVYIASISSFYRILRENGLLNHRRNTRPNKKRNKPIQKIATGPDQVWCWDITCLHSNVRGAYYYAYTIIDIWDRSIVKWAIHDRESGELARELFQQALSENGNPDVSVHSDNGSPMKGVTLLSLFYELGISNSYSRPRVSNDNPFIESWFKTLKYDVSYPRVFCSLDFSREWFADFVESYNSKHRHSGIYYITPKEMRNGRYEEIALKRNKVMMEAKDKNPIRWSQKVKQLPLKHKVILNPDSLTTIQLKNKDNENAA